MPATNDELVKLLKEARKIIRASPVRTLHKDWDARTTKALAKPKKWVGKIDAPGDFQVDSYALKRNGGFAPFHLDLGIKVTHKPTGLTASCGTERSDHANRQKAWEELQTKLTEYLA